MAKVSELYDVTWEGNSGRGGRAKTKSSGNECDGHLLLSESWILCSLFRTGVLTERAELVAEVEVEADLSFGPATDRCRRSSPSLVFMDRQTYLRANSGAQGSFHREAGGTWGCWAAPRRRDRFLLKLLCS